ncbi:hypothetical protein [Arenimonas composti]|uniref:Uncharacterized protein n=1 Tax=Arenimonas composti TR7-09 = DSM 18010 TaxID=1121013 RepID=A0A091BHA3_9GAMM|nr:hypothetical protein [Arenimonas composti]KFN50169.1 hypothetical protein P873_07990 [Arenimonas composti TR7-09 = DSM 18010]
MSVREAQTLPQAAADAIDALVHLVVFSAAEGHGTFAAAAHDSLRQLLEAPESRQIVPAEYFDGRDDDVEVAIPRPRNSFLTM